MQINLGVVKIEHLLIARICQTLQLISMIFVKWKSEKNACVFIYLHTYYFPVSFCFNDVIVTLILKSDHIARRGVWTSSEFPQPVESDQAVWSRKKTIANQFDDLAIVGA